MKQLIFEASKGIMGQYGYVRISFWRWLWMKFSGGLSMFGPYVLRTRWIEKPTKVRESTHEKK